MGLNLRGEFTNGHSKNHRKHCPDGKHQNSGLDGMDDDVVTLAAAQLCQAQEILPPLLYRFYEVFDPFGHELLRKLIAGNEIGEGFFGELEKLDKILLGLFDQILFFQILVERCNDTFLRRSALLEQR